MDYSCHHNVIELFGKFPKVNIMNQKEETLDFIIRVEDLYGFILREFHICYVPEKIVPKFKDYNEEADPKKILNSKHLA